MRHGRATIPFGKWKGTRIRHLPDDYLSFLASLPMMLDPQWNWLKESLLAEMRFRGMNAVLDPPHVMHIVQKKQMELGAEPRT